MIPNGIIKAENFFILVLNLLLSTISFICRLQYEQLLLLKVPYSLLNPYIIYNHTTRACQCSFVSSLILFLIHYEPAVQ